MTDILGPANADNATTERPDDTRTFGTLDTWLKDCSTPLSDDGTELTASMFNGILATLRSLWRGNGGLAADPTTKIVPEVGTDDNGLLKSVQHLIQRGQPSYAVDTGAVNALVVALSPAPPEYKAGLTVRVKAKVTNTDAATIDVNGLGAKSIKHPDGSGLVADDLIENGIAELIYDGTNFQLVATHTDRTGGAGVERYRVPYVVAGGTSTAITATYTPSTPTPQAGDLFSVKLAAAINTVTTFAPDGHGPYPLLDMNGQSPIAGFAATNDRLLIEFDGTNMIVVNKGNPVSAGQVLSPGAVGSYALAGPSLQPFSNGSGGPLFAGSWRVMSKGGPTTAGYDVIYTVIEALKAGTGNPGPTAFYALMQRYA